MIVGDLAPELILGGHPAPAGHGPRVLAFTRAWSPEATTGELRAHLRGLGAALVIVTPTAAWSLRPDDAVAPIAATPAELAAAATAYGSIDDALFVIDGRGVVRFCHRDPAPIGATLGEAIALAGRAMRSRERHSTLQDRVLFTRREWSVTCLVVGCTTAVLAACKQPSKPEADRKAAPPPATDIPASINVTLMINGQQKKLAIDPRASLLDTLRETLGLTGTKKGCDAGQCGACTVLVGGKRVLSCLTLAAMAQGKDKDITTIEGLASSDGALHPMQQAFVEHDGLQCGYCTPGQIISAVALVREGRATTDAEVREEMSGNLCRCGAYPNIVAAIQSTRRARG